MATFTIEELNRRQLVGIAATAAFALTAIICHIALKQEAGVPEFLETARGTAWASCVVAAIWTGLASALKEFRQ
jgi:hypothetical protein